MIGPLIEGVYNNSATSLWFTSQQDELGHGPEVDRNRLACVGLSVGGYRSFLLAALDPRIRARWTWAG